MRFSDIDDCGMCLMMKRGYCKGGVTLGSCGEPVYPPCADMPEKTDEEAVKSIEEYLANQVRKEHEEEVKRLIQASKKKRSDYLRRATLLESNAVSKIKKSIKLTQKSKDDMEIHIKARMVTDILFGGEKISDEEIDKRVSEELKPYDLKLEILNKNLKDAEDRLKEKRKEIRKEKGYIRSGSVRKPKRGTEQEWEKKIVDYVDVATLEKMWDCIRDLEENDYTIDNYLLVFIKKGALYYFRAYDGVEWKSLGYLDDLCKYSRGDKLYRGFLRDLLKDLGESVDVIVLPSRLKGFSFYFNYPACFKTYSDFKDALAEVIGDRRVQV